MFAELTDVKEAVLERILMADRKSACRLIRQWADDQGTGVAATELLESVLTQIGELWNTETDVSIAQAYVAAKVAEDVLQDVAASDSPDAGCPAAKGPVVLGNAEDDCHALGRRLVGAFLRAAGWEVCDLGNDVPAVALIDKAVELGARIVAVSAMMYTNAMNIARVREEIDRRNLTGQLQLAVGGAVFVLRPELVAAVGGDGTARNALAAPQLMETLWGRATSQGDKP